MRIVLTGGGTGGHLYPVLSLARALSAECAEPGQCWPVKTGHELLFVGSRDGLEREIVADSGIPGAFVTSRPLAGSSPLRAAAALAACGLGAAQALPLLKRFAPDVVIAAGGYASAPVVTATAGLRAARLLSGTKIVLLEANAQPGLANRVLARLADEVWGGYVETAAFFPGKFVRTGVPVRPEFYTPPAQAQARLGLGLDAERSTILVFGGSQGARSINAATSAMVARRRLPRAWQVLHVTGKRDYEWMMAERKAEPNANRYHIRPYLADMARAYAAADVAVCRAGASTLAELAVAGVPAILIPYPFAAEDHQTKNAALFAGAQAAIVIEDTKLDADSLYWGLVAILDPSKLPVMREAVRRLAQPRALHAMVERILTSRIGRRVSAADTLN